ncbi:carbohydrate ABC transporter permease [Treponema parvum]|uniref:Carbohydrate ABC transporter permease n=1 Tax=Treponema parvum TaxID=138851 RepID=A0A975F3B8_9SPIR|nr:carbohydrate ABC transporter permease [Treponema parvum]QTQ13880.1 carbohydrate ABC transporter permease [Treponema parvum]
MKESNGEKIFHFVNDFIMILTALICLLPVVHIFARAFSGASAIGTGKVIFWPVQFHVKGITYILEYTGFLRSLLNSVIITIIGTVFALLCTILTAFALAHEKLKGRNVIIYIYVFSMIFNAGIVPHYFLIKNLHLLNTLWCLILPSVVSPYYTFVLKRGFESVPSALEEAAMIDGASWFTILRLVVLPVTKAQVATIVVFYSVHYWNKYFDAMVYITDNNLKPITMFLYDMVKHTNIIDFSGAYGSMTNLSQDVFNAATVFLTVIPILAVYPFMQKYFIKGAVAGAVKG